MRLENCQESKSEHFIFTLTDSKGQRMYGMCLRGLFKGVRKRFDVPRRRRHCLCIITKYPFFSMFHAMLLQLHSLALLDRDTPRDGTRSIWCWRFLSAVYQQPLLSEGQLHSLIVAWDAHPDLLMQRSFILIPPRSIQSGVSLHRESRILPLLEVLGVDRFFKLLSAILCERRIIFVADDVELLSSSVIAAASLLAPFQWQHLFIPLLPSKLLVYVSAPTPYIYGVRRYLTAELKKQLTADIRAESESDPRNGVLIVDMNSGDMHVFGKVEIVDLGERARETAIEACIQ